MCVCVCMREREREGLKITGEKHAGNLGVGEFIAPKSCTLVPCALNVSLGD